jgi:hypothetical protein
LGIVVEAFNQVLPHRRLGPQVQPETPARVPWHDQSHSMGAN